MASDRKSALLVAILGGAALFGCTGEKKPEMSNQVLHANGPDWVNRGSGAFADEKGKMFHGVGIVSGVRNAALRRNVADSRAHDEMKQTLEDYVEALQKDYPAQATAPSDGGISEKDRLQQALKAYSQGDLGVAVVDHWVDTDGTEYALAELDLAAFESNLDKAKDLDARARAALRANAQKAFDELSAERASHQR